MSYLDYKDLGKILSLAAWDLSTQKKFFEFIQVSSLTKYLKNLSDKFSVRLTYLGEKELDASDMIEDERLSRYFVREVDLLLDNIEVVRARSSCRVDSDYWIGFLDCGENPIGERLFNLEKISRSDFKYGILSQEHSLLKQVVSRGDIVFRQSLFDVSQEKLILTECFLPSIKQFL